MSLRQSRREEVERASYYVWFLGTEESRGLRGREYVAPVVAELVRKERHVEPCKVTLQLSGKGMKIVQHVARPGSGRAGQVKHFVPDHAVTCAVREPPPDDDIVSCILLVFNPVTKCPVHVHTYRCDTPETAAMLEAQLQALADRPENRARIQQIEARLVERGLLVAPPAGSARPEVTSGGRKGRAAAAHREQGGPAPAGKTGYQEDSSGIGSDDTPSPDHRERTSSDEEWTAAGNSSEDLLHDTSSRWRHKPVRLDSRDSAERQLSPDTEERITSGISSTRKTASQRQRSPPSGRDRSGGRCRLVPLEGAREDAPPPPPQRPPPDVTPAEVRDGRGQERWRVSLPPPDGSRSGYEAAPERARWRPAGARPRAAEDTRAEGRAEGRAERAESRGRQSVARSRHEEAALAPPGAGSEPRPDEVLSRVDRWVMSSVAVAEAAVPGVRRRHSGRQHADGRGRSPSSEGRLLKSRSTDTFLEHDVVAPSGREARESRRAGAPVAEEMRRQSMARDEPLQRSRSSAQVADECRRLAVARGDEVQRCRSSSQVADELRRRFATREAREARESSRDAREVGREVGRELLRDASREPSRPRSAMQRCRSSTSLLTDPDRGRHQEAGSWRGERRPDRRSPPAETGRRWGTLDRGRPSRHRQPSHEPEQRHLPHDGRPLEGGSRARSQRAGSRTPDELWIAPPAPGHEGRGRSRYSVADPRGMTRYDYRPTVAAQQY